MSEEAIIGWKAIGDMFQKSPTAMMRRRKEFEEAGVIFFMRHGSRPGRRMVHAFPSMLLRYVVVKSSSGEKI